MTLIIILIALVVEQFVGVTADFRQFNWFEKYLQWLENKIGQHKIWNGAFGVIITLGGPLIFLWLITGILENISLLFSFLFALAVLLYSFGTNFLNPELDDYIKALEENDKAKINKLEEELFQSGDSGEKEKLFIEKVLINTNERLFGVLFWFLVLGLFGALLYRLAIQLRLQQSDIHGSYSDSVRDLCNILNWPVARLLALGNALSGNLVDAIDAWHESERDSFQANEEVIKASGLGALQYRPGLSSIDDSIENERYYWMQSLQGLLNRTIIIWLTVVGLISLAGWIG
jgi:membrane protein required for beta-lactamase induction